jgi:hypothetical protein
MKNAGWSQSNEMIKEPAGTLRAGFRAWHGCARFTIFGNLRSNMPELMHKPNETPLAGTGFFASMYSSLKHVRRIRRSPYYGVLSRIHGRLKPRTYVEIGVNCGDALMLARKADIAIGIDPAPTIRVVLPPVARLYKTTSDAFFADYDLKAELGQKPVDLAFIDGMHLFEFALRDFVNIERYCTRDSTILAHDCRPMDRASAERERTTHFWSGDVWKLVVCLKKYRPDLKIRTVDVDLTGLTIIRGLDPASKVLSSRLREIENEFIPKTFDEIETGMAQKLNLVPNNWTDIAAFLSE